MVGKIRLACAPMINHWWQTPLHVTARGLGTLAMPHGEKTFEIEFDFLEQVLRIQVSDGGQRSIGLGARPLAEFYHEVMDALDVLEVPVRIWPQPVEITDEPIAFDRDSRHGAYEPEHARRFWEVLRQAHRVLTEFRSGFLGKCSPVHFFWGSFDLAVTRFSGRRAPEHPGGIPHLADYVAREAYSRECASCGFWPGGGEVQEPAFYAYAYPEPPGYRDYPLDSADAYYSDVMREYILPYDAVRRAPEPDRVLHRFLQSSYEAAAELGRWSRDELEREGPSPAPTRAGRAPAFPHQEESGK